MTFPTLMNTAIRSLLFSQSFLCSHLSFGWGSTIKAILIAQRKKRAKNTTSNPLKKGLVLRFIIWQLLTSLYSNISWRLRNEATTISNHNFRPMFANLRATPNITALVKSPRSRLHARAIAPPTTRSLGMLLPSGFFSDEPDFSIAMVSLVLFSTDLK